MRGLTLLFLGLAVSGFAQSPAELAGRWRSVETSKGGLGAMYDFMADGTAQYSPGAILRIQYRQEGDRVIKTPDNGLLFTVSAINATQLKVDISGTAETYTRLGAQPDPGNPLLGEWTGTRMMDGNPIGVHWTFAADGAAVMMLRFLTAPGRYQLSGGQLKATFGGRGTLSGAVDVSNGVLSIHRANGSVMKLQRY